MISPAAAARPRLKTCSARPARSSISFGKERRKPWISRRRSGAPASNAGSRRYATRFATRPSDAIMPRSCAAASRHSSRPRGQTGPKPGGRRPAPGGVIRAASAPAMRPNPAMFRCRPGSARSLAQSPLLRPSRPGIPGREAVILLLFINHPNLLEVHGEALAELDLSSSEAHALRTKTARPVGAGGRVSW